ncbi:MAG: hypothetical protein RBS07_15855 [Lentimicrobium sp.]|jgi:hypothetical protein|nr:hypothetical protein [Lentimicrobium sp.]
MEIIVIGLIVLGLVIINAIIKKKRINLEIDLRVIYDKIEVSVIKNRNTPDNALLDYLKRHKFFAINPDFADIQMVLYAATRMDDKQIKENIAESESLKETLSTETRELIAEFNNRIHKLIKLSLLKPSFFLFLFIVGFKIITHKGLTGCRTIYYRVLSLRIIDCQKNVINGNLNYC